MEPKKRNIALFALVPLALVLATTGCTSLLDGSAPESPESVSVDAAISENQASQYDPDDLAYDEAEVVQIVLDGTSVSADSDNVSIAGSTVTISAAGAYAIAGTLSDGSIRVDAGDDDVILILEGVDVTNTEGAAIAVMSADEVSIILAENSTNWLTDGSNYVFPDAETDEPNAALYSADDLTIAGSGELIVTANFNDGIASKDGLAIVDGTIRVAATDDGLRGKDYVIVSGGSLVIDAGGDGIKSDNDEDLERGYVQVTGGTIQITADDDGVQAATDLLIMGGESTIDAGLNSAAGRALLGTVMVVVTDGVVVATSVDDAVHSNGEVLIVDGDLTLASADDGLHADNLVTIEGGSVTITNAFEGIEAEYIVINGGTIDITSNDDGINVASADATTTTTTTGPGGGPGGGPADEVTGDFSVYINGGMTSITVTGTLDEQGDGIDANGHLKMTGGVVAVSGPTDTRNSAVDYGTFEISGGLFIGTNIDGRNSQGFGAGSTQASLYTTLSSPVAAGTVVHIESAEDGGLVTFVPANAYDVVMFSSPDLVDGGQYDIYIGGAVTGDTATNLYEDADYSVGELEDTATASL